MVPLSCTALVRASWSYIPNNVSEEGILVASQDVWCPADLFVAGRITTKGSKEAPTELVKPHEQCEVYVAIPCLTCHTSSTAGYMNQYD